MFTLQFTTDNAAFEDCPEAEIARILRALAGKVERGETDGTVRDANGNRVGEWGWIAPEGA